MADIKIVGYMPHGSRGGQITKHQQDIVVGKDGIMKAVTAGSHGNAEWMQLLCEIYAL